MMIIRSFINPRLALVRFSCISYPGKFNCVRKDKFKMKISQVYIDSACDMINIQDQKETEKR